MTAPMDVVELARALIRCPSVTPDDAGALKVLEGALGPLGFACRRLPFSDATERVENLYARHGDAAPVFCFAGHTDVVPVGNAAAWTVDPFGAEIIDGVLYGRGAVDMKGAVAAFAAAAAAFLAERKGAFRGSIACLITGDEEGRSINGTRKVLEQLREEGEGFDACLVGEPTNPKTLGDMIKVGRRGSLSGTLLMRGVQGHTAYPDLADNPIPKMLRLLEALVKVPLDSGTEHFPPSNLEITSVDVGNPVTNVIPAMITATFNVRFGDAYTSESLERLLRESLNKAGPDYDLRIEVTGEPFLTKPGALSDLVAGAVRQVTGRTPELSTSGGTSDARFLKDAAPVVEFGLAGSTMHKVDERVAIADLEALTEIYKRILDGYFSA
ncbi:MAG: succinyl-diaminopimelate desuccinylase [Alphaproteobacteria bacterium]|nr:succinyl-diaminopimelate desuccinylase [Alphaproteobacteria bacterium]